MQYDEDVEAELLQKISFLEVLPFYPKTDTGLIGFAMSIAEMANTMGEADWLLTRIRKGCLKFPSPLEARRIFIRKYTCADGESPDKIDMTEVMDGRA